MGGFYVFVAPALLTALTAICAHATFVRRGRQSRFASAARLVVLAVLLTAYSHAWTSLILQPGRFDLAALFHLSVMLLVGALLVAPAVLAAVGCQTPKMIAVAFDAVCRRAPALGGATLDWLRGTLRLAAYAH